MAEKPKSKEYTMGMDGDERVFIQWPVSAGQMEHLWTAILDFVKAGENKEAFDAAFHTLHKNIYKVMAVVLVPKGETRADVLKRLDTPGGIDDLMSWFRVNATPDQVQELVQDFFDLNPKVLHSLGMLNWGVETVTGQRVLKTEIPSTSTSKPIMPTSVVEPVLAETKSEKT